MAGFFGLQILFHDFSGLFALSYPLGENPWTLLTSVYSHGGLAHLSSNMIALFIFAGPVARLTSGIRYHLFFISVGSLAGVFQIMFLYYLEAFGVVSFEAFPGVLGSSGAIFGFFGYLVVSNSVSSFFGKWISFSRKVRYTIYFLTAGLVTWATASPGVALVAHFTGFFLGMILGKKGILNLESDNQQNSS